MVRDAVADLAGGKVAEATIAWGGYTPSPTYSLRLADGRRFFLKCCPPTASELMRSHFGTEIMVYTCGGEVVREWAPRILGHRCFGDWRILLLEDLGPADVPPWSAAIAHEIMHSLARFHAAQRPGLPEWLETPATWLRRGFSWEWIADANALVQRVRFAGAEAAQAAKWFTSHGPLLRALAYRLAEAKSVQFLHGDIRSDNLRWKDGRLYLLDWSLVVAGPAEFDLAFFAQSIGAESELRAQDAADMYHEVEPLDPQLLSASVCASASFFFDQAWQEELPGFPRLRMFQKRQRAVCFEWMLDRIGLPAPPWARTLRSETG